MVTAGKEEEPVELLFQMFYRFLNEFPESNSHYKPYGIFLQNSLKWSFTNGKLMGNYIKYLSLQNSESHKLIHDKGGRQS